LRVRGASKQATERALHSLRKETTTQDFRDKKMFRSG